MTIFCGIIRTEFSKRRIPMSNGEIQPNTTRSRKGRVRIGIEREIQTSKFHQLVITCNIDEEIEWTSLEDWYQKRRNWDAILIRKYKEMRDQIMEELGFEEKVAYIKSSDQNAVNADKTLGELDDLEELN